MNMMTALRRIHADHWGGGGVTGPYEELGDFDTWCERNCPLILDATEAEQQIITLYRAHREALAKAGA